MKTLLGTSLTWISILFSALGSDIRSLHLVLSPFYDAADRQLASTAIAEIVAKAPVGCRVRVLDGWNLETIAELGLPQNLHMAEALAARRRAVRTDLARVVAWLGRATNAPAESGLAGSAMVDLPRALEHCSTAPSDELESILILGSPIYHSPLEPQFSFLPDRFPSDAHLGTERASSVFSVQDKRQRLRNRRVFVWYPRERCFGSDLYRDRVERFWSLFVRYQEGVLASFGADGRQTLGDLFRPQVTATRTDGLDPAFKKVEMLSVHRDIPYRRMTNVAGEVTYTLAPLPNEESRPSGLRAERRMLKDLSEVPADKTAIGIMWAIPGLDLDLYVWTRDDAPPLCFGNTRSADGNYIHDYTDRNDSVDYEKVILENSPASRDALKVAVNFYAGSTSAPVTGKVYLRYEGITYTGTFTIQAQQGNRGADRLTRLANPAWTEVQLGKLQPVATQAASR